MTKQEIIAALQEMGLKNGDKVLLHSSLLSLGEVEGGPDAVIDAFLELLGSEGTLLVPVFGALGILTETLKKQRRIKWILTRLLLNLKLISRLKRV